MDVVYTRSTREFRFFSLLLLLCAILDMACYYIHKILKEKLRVYYVTGLRRDLFQGIMRRSIRDFTSAPAAQYESVLLRDVSKMDTCYFESFCGFYKVSVNFVINIILIVYMSPWIALLNILTSSGSVFIPRLFETRLIQKQKEASDQSGKYYGRLSDYLYGFTTIKIFHIQSIVKEMLEKNNREMEEANYESVKANFTASWFSMLCSQCSFVLTMVVGVFCALKGWMTVGTVIALSQMIGGIVVPFEQFPEYIANIRSVKGIREKIDQILAGGNAATDEHKEPIEVRTCDICLKNVSFSYGRNNVLESITMHLHKGRKYILLGESGCGKSTLAKLIAGFYPCDNGTITIDGTDLNAYPEEQLYQIVNYLEQDVFLFDGTMRENITLYRDYPEDKLSDAIRKAGLEQLILSLPDGMESRINGNGQNFSGGERQRIGIARALLSGAEFIVFDEITANLDPRLAVEIENSIMANRDIGVLMITHRWAPELLKKADGIFLMRNGKIYQQGKYEDIFSFFKTSSRGFP